MSNIAHTLLIDNTTILMRIKDGYYIAPQTHTTSSSWKLSTVCTDSDDETHNQ